MKKYILSWLCSIPLLLAIPYLCIIGFQGADTALLERRCSVEDLLPMIVKTQIEADYELETVKCQAVITRSNFYRRFAEQEDFIESMNAFLDQTGLRKNKGSVSFWVDEMSDLWQGKYKDAVKETEGIVLQYQGEWKLVPYHEISNGCTRNGKEVFHDQAYAYLVSVDSEKDREAENYINQIVLPADRIPEQLLVLERDSEGYVLSFISDGKLMEGEAFREGLRLPSSDITIRKKGDQYYFICKGKGHGLGLSQYGANVLALEGKNYDFILERYFPMMDLCKITRVNDR